MKLLLLKNIVSQTKIRFRNLSIKRTALTMTLLVVGMLLSSSAFAANIVTAIPLQAPTSQTGSYASNTAITYTISLTKQSNNNGTEAISLGWTSTVPAGVNIAFSKGASYNPKNVNTITLTLTPTSGTTQLGTYPFKITNVETGGLTTTTTGTLIIGPKTITVSGLDVANRAYDGTTNATITGTPTLVGVLAADNSNVTIVGPATATFASANVNNGIGVTVTGYTLSGSAATRYTLTQPTGITGNITQATLTITGITANNKVYDGTTAATFTGGTLVGVFGADNVTINPAGTFSSAAIGTHTVTVSLSGTATGNYSLTQPGISASIVAATYDWTGAIGNAWANPANWNVAGVTTLTTYPGQTNNNDDVQIGVSTTIGSITVFPTIGASYTINSLTFGNNSGNPSLIINTTKTLSLDNFTVSANTNATITDNGALTIDGTFTNNSTATLNLNGSKSFTVNTFNNITNAGTLTQTGAGSVSFSNTSFGGSITNSGTINQSGTGAFSMNITALGGIMNNTGTINQTGNASFSMTMFSIVGTINNSGIISQSSASGTMTFGVPFSNSTPGSKLTQTGTGTLAFSKTFSNSGTTTFGPGIVTMGDDFTNVAGTTTFGSGTATLSGDFTNTTGTTAFGTGSATVAGNFSNSGTVTSSTGTISFGSSQFTNSGPLTFGTGLVTFTYGASVTKFDANTDITLVNVAFKGGKNVQLPHSGNIYLASNGVLTLSNSTQLSQAAGSFTLLSDASGSATIAAIPAGCSITGTVNVQRFIKGSSDVGDLSKRGYRLLSSAIHTNTALVGGVNVYDLQYLTSSVYVSGAGGINNGFNVTTTQNPSVYLFREDVPPPPAGVTNFTTGYNWKGVAQINNSPLYEIGTQAKATTNNVADAQYTLPVGNAVLFFFRGDKTPSVLTAPFSAPADVTLTQTGTLNTGTIPVQLWFAAEDGLGNNFSWTDPSTNIAYTTSGSQLTNGYALVGNPYPSTINWERYNNTNASGALTGSVSNTIWMFNPTNKQYEAYQATNDPDITTEFTQANSGSAIGAASNFIASGQGFFVRATAANQTLTFTENAKISAQPTAANLNELMGKPVQFTSAPRPFIRFKMAMDSINTDEIIIRLDNKASTKFLATEDAEDLGGNGSQIGLSAFSSDSVRLAIDVVPYPGVKPEVIRLQSNSSSTGSYTFTVPLLKNLPALYQAWLKDAFTGDSLQLKTGANYQFTIDKSNAATFGGNRFTVVIRQDTAFAYKLLDFTASKTNHQSDVQLVWKTANEGNYTNFTVERSTDNGKTFTVVGGMAATGAGNYSLVDKNPDKGRNLYRLKQEDINDSITYSKVVDVKFGDVFSKLHIFPNPATHTVNLAIAEEGYYKGNYSISFVNSSGRVVKEVKSSQADWQGNITYLMPGTYLVRVVNTKTQSLVGENKFVKL